MRRVYLGEMAKISARSVRWCEAAIQSSPAAANTTLTAFVVLSHSNANIGLVIALLVVIGQLIAGTICVHKWRTVARVV